MNDLDSDLLRSFLAVAETGSMTAAADRRHRTQSAISLQIKRLESVLGQPVFDRHGRGVRLTPAGETLLPVAREVTARLDDTLRALSCTGMTGRLCVGIPDDHSRDRLARIIADFARAHPGVELEVTCDLSAGLPRALETGALDLAVLEVARPGPADEVLWQDPTHWMVSRYHDIASHDPVQVALFDRDCWWRDAALAALAAAGRDHRVVCSSQSVAGVLAAVEAGIAVGLLGASARSDRLRVLGEDDGFPKMPVSHLILGHSTGPASPARHGMADAIRRAFAQARPT